MAVNINHSNPDTEDAYRRRYMSPALTCPRTSTEVEGYGDDCAGQMTAGVGIGFGITVAMVLLLVGIGFWWWSRQKNRRVFVFSGCDKFDKYLVGGGGASAATRGDWFPRVGTSLVDGPSLSGSYAY